jgi:hypothetical protein
VWWLFFFKEIFRIKRSKIEVLDVFAGFEKLI